MIEAGFFDLDKTTIDENGVIYDGLGEALKSNRDTFKRTILTARGFPRFRQAITENPDLAVTPGMPVALENGARIINSESYDNLYYHPLSEDELTAICDYIDAADEPFRYVAFHSQEPRTKTLLWSPDPQEAERLHNAYSENADVFTGNKEQLFRTINTQNPCMVTCRTYGKSPRDLPDITFYSRGSTVNFTPQDTDKGTATEMIADMSGVDLANSLAAGNDHNDIPVLSLERLGLPIAVGLDMTDEMRMQLPERSIYIPDPRKLGAFIAQKVA